MCLINTFDLIRLAFYRPIRWINVLLPGLTNECTHFKFRWRYKCYVLSLCIFPHVSDFMPVYASNSFMFQKMFNRSHLGHTQAVVRRIQCNTGTGSFWDQYGSVACIEPIDLTSCQSCWFNYRWLEQWQCDLSFSSGSWWASSNTEHYSWRTCEGLQLKDKNSLLYASIQHKRLQVSFKNLLWNIHTKMCCNGCQINLSAALQLLPGWIIQELVQIKTSRHYLIIRLVFIKE